jgi:hypothetical protein
MTVTSSDERRYSYNKFKKGVLLLLFFWFLYGFIMLFYGFFNVLLVNIQMSLNEEMGITSSFFPLMCFALFVPFYSFFPIIIGIIQPDVRVTDTGMFVQVFFFWWVFVPWKNILEITTRSKKSILHRQTTVVWVQKLTPFHRLIGVIGGKLKPCFQIEPSISGYNELIGLIQKKVEQNGKI